MDGPDLGEIVFMIFLGHIKGAEGVGLFSLHQIWRNRVIYLRDPISTACFIHSLDVLAPTT